MTKYRFNKISPFLFHFLYFWSSSFWDSHWDMKNVVFHVKLDVSCMRKSAILSINSHSQSVTPILRSFLRPMFPLDGMLSPWSNPTMSSMSIYPRLSKQLCVWSNLASPAVFFVRISCYYLHDNRQEKQCERTVGLVTSLLSFPHNTSSRGLSLCPNFL